MAAKMKAVSKRLVGTPPDCPIGAAIALALLIWYFFAQPVTCDSSSMLWVRAGAKTGKALPRLALCAQANITPNWIRTSATALGN
jgi:hypothetical protein